VRQPLDKQLRSQLEKTVGEARDIAEKAARITVERLGVEKSKPDAALNDVEKKLYKRLRAHGLQLGDKRDDSGKQGIDLLVEETAYQYWHRMLFARFLAENNLLMYFEAGTPVPVSLADCEELAKERGMDSMEFAAAFASKMLPQIFPIDSPVFELKLASNYIQDLEKRLYDLSPVTFQASDSLGWIYQFWQAKRKKEINETNKKIGARELPAVTQLFTEPYMVSFLLDNSLGAWWANRTLADDDFKNAQTEEELRQKAALPGLPLRYLRFVKNKAGFWIPAAGKFEDWPKKEKLREFKVLDPCCGSGHFLVAALQMLVPIRCVVEKLSVKDAINAVLKENLHGLELDMRCVEIAAFNLAFTAWTFPGAEGWRPLPELQVACSGLSVGVSKEDWIKISGKNKKLPYILGLLYGDFENAPTLGSLLNISMKLKEGIDWGDVYESLKYESLKTEDASVWHETSVTAQGVAKAAELLNKKYHWIITNPPYLAWGKQEDILKSYFEKNYSKSKNDIATAFLERCFKFCVYDNGTISIVLPQNWLFLTTYKHLREKLLKNEIWRLLVRLGSRSFETISGEVVKAILLTISRRNPNDIKPAITKSEMIHGLDVSDIKSPKDKDTALINCEIKSIEQEKQLKNPDARITFDDTDNKKLFSKKANSYQGIATGDYLHYGRFFWEIMNVDDKIWIYQQSTVDSTCDFGGKSNILYWDNGGGELAMSDSARIQGLEAWAKWGIAVTQMRKIPVTLHISTTFDNNTAVIVPKDKTHLPAIWCYCSSPEYNETVRRIDKKLNVTNATLVKVPFDLNHWKKVAKEKYPHGLPLPYSDDPTQWIFHGHPCGSVVWDETTKKTAQGQFRCDKTVLHIAVARLLGYRWPAELDVGMELAEEQREWVNRCTELAQFADEDGIVSIPAMRKEQSAENRLLGILETSYGKAWSVAALQRLLKSSGCEGTSLEYWLRNDFFRQHCELFGQRPFIWHIWDGLKDGFSVLVNYHKLGSRLLDSLIYTYLGDWISRQEREKGRTDGATERLDAARSLRQKLLAIQTGEAPLDIFVRWKPLDEQPIGWNPDLNDGVRLNIRPFMLAGDVKVRGAGVLRDKPKISWKNDRGADAPSAPWYNLGSSKGFDEGTRINDHHLTLEEKQKAKEKKND
jgi:hypothetical protein